MIKILNSKGQTLIEVLVALGVGVAVLLAVTNAVLSSLTGSDFGRNQSLATQYAQQGMEVVRNIRNSGWTIFYNTYTTAPVGASKFYCLDENIVFTISGNCPQNIAAFFTRRLELIRIDADRVRIIVKTSFTDSKGEHKSELISIFTNWNQ